MKPARNIVSTFAFLMLALGCASYKTFNDVRPDELNTSTLWPGLELQLEYVDGTKGEFTIREVKDESIVATDGKVWPKTGIRTLTIKVPPSMAYCGSVASLENRLCR